MKKQTGSKLVSAWKNDFPLLKKSKSLHYLDAAATTQKPKLVMDAVKEFQTKSNANIHRGVYRLAENATAEYEYIRDMIHQFIGANSVHEIVFTSGTTMAMNLLAESWGKKNLSAGDEIILTAMEHHAVIVPWTELARQLDVKVRIIPLTDKGLLDMKEYENALNKKTKAVIMTAMSNVLGSVVDLKKIGEAAHRVDAKVFIDGAQYIAHRNINVSKLPIDGLVFSGHKVYGNFGAGVLWVKLDTLEMMPRYMGGGAMISRVTWDHIDYREVPYRFEAGTPNISGVISMGAGVKYLKAAWKSGAKQHEEALLKELLSKLSADKDITIYGPASLKDRGPIVSFNVGNIHPHDLASILDQHNVAIRAGHHCTMPLHSSLGVPATARASLAVWNESRDIDSLIKGINAAKAILMR